MISEMMIQSEKMLSVGGLAAGMAHEINNPLAGMMQTANVMHNRLSGSQAIKANLIAAKNAGFEMQALESYMSERGILSMLENIIESGKRVALIVENMLDFSRQNSSNAREQDLVTLLDKSVELSATDYNLKYGYDFRNINIRIYIRYFFICNFECCFILGMNITIVYIFNLTIIIIKHCS